MVQASFHEVYTTDLLLTMPCLCFSYFSRQNNFMRFTCYLILNIDAKILRANFGFGAWSDQMQNPIS